MLSKKHCLVILLLFASLSSCRKDYLSDVERAQLFATPTVSEINSISQNWQTRNLIPTDYSILKADRIDPGGLTVKIISYKIAGIVEYAALIIPDGNDKIPVRIWVGGFGLGLTTNSVRLQMSSGSNNNRFIMAIPALRGQSLELAINDIVYTTPLSGGEHCDAFDGATDDVIALINLIDVTESSADVNRTGVRGGSRGATVAMLAGIRDPRVKRVVAVAGPTDLLALTPDHENDPTYQCQFLSAYKNNQSSLAETRAKMIASSPFYFAANLPLTQLHLGSNDRIVPVAQGYTLQEKMEASGNAARFSLFTYNRGHEDIATDNSEMATRIETFFSGL